ncbi:MAG: hypothetical protein PHU23_05975 [Dehalococcoidales bacterium]|nr:hypothetical protein [Dehalococcoidales bacterium]
MSEIISIIALITGIISLILILYKIGVRDGKVDTKLDVLWNVYVMDALHNEANLAQHHSPPTITPEGEAIIPADFKQCIEKHTCKDGNYGFEVVQCLGMEKVQKFAQDNDWTMQKALGILTLYMRKVKNVQ